MSGHLYRIIFLFVFLAALQPLHSQLGCTDPLANNYNAAAISNDGSCTYNITTYNPGIKVNQLSNTVNETSGLQFMDGYLWTFNDSGGDPVLYCIDTLSNTILQTVTLEGATNVDWEDMAFDGTHVYIGDFGNNINGARTNLRIYKFPLSAIPDRLSNPLATIPFAAIEIIQFTYANQPQPPAATSQFNTRFDCEAMIVDAGKIHLFTKNYVDLNTVHFEIAGLEAGAKMAMPVDTFSSNFLVTGADIIPGEDIIILLGYFFPNPLGGNFGNHFLTILSDYADTKYFSGNKRILNLPNVLIMGQAEGICFRNNRYGYISNEAVSQSGFNIPAQLKAFDVRGFISESILSFELKAFTIRTEGGADLLSWLFDRRVRELQLQYSGDGINFKNIYQTALTESGSYRFGATTGTGFYRLQWQDAAGNQQYSQILQTHKNPKEKIRKISATRQGRLFFTWQGNASVRLSFEMLTVEGKRIGTISAREYAPGLHQVYFPNFMSGSSVVFLRVTTKDVSESLPVFIQ